MNTEKSESPPIRFGAFELDSAAGELRKHGIKIKLQEQPLQILQKLLESPGEVVTREELQKRIWPADTFVDFDHGLYSAVQRLGTPWEIPPKRLDTSRRCRVGVIASSVRCFNSKTILDVKPFRKTDVH